MDIYFDGSTALNSVCFYDKSKDSYEITRLHGKYTNNELEYHALYKAVDYVRHYYPSLDDTCFIGDSEVIIKQMKGQYECKAGNLKPLRVRIIARAGPRLNIRNFKWVPRDQNLAGIILEDELNKQKTRKKLYGSL